VESGCETDCGFCFVGDFYRLVAKVSDWFVGPWQEPGVHQHST
jgi:hypothetical protein